MAKRLLLTMMMGVLMISAYAQNHFPNFDPARFRQDFIASIVAEAGLTDQEKKAVVPIYDDYLAKKQALFMQMGKYGQWRGTNDKSYADAIEDIDRIAIDLKKLQQSLHRQLLKILSAKKVYALIRAERGFNKRYFQRFTRRR